ncbi:hypothetical protein [Nonomuraea glycinis]|jgi:hypothetical protein|uniref:hypothetical protein n=1 Tax=Nonomuraea glycinis TaxID=2047744 RepID=UPI002E15A0FC|nr:hypothetical protein OHA68_19555 [Nonomuraea glycinis]
MNRMLAGLALASAAALMAATPAQAAITQAPAKPVTAVKKQLVPGKGVTFTERTTLDSGRMRAVFVRSSGTYQFSRSGLAASDITGKLNIKASDLADLGEGSMFQSLAKPERTIRIGTTSYLSGSIWAELLPSGKTWYKAPGGPPAGFTGIFGQPLNIVEPATLKTLFKNAKPASGGYTGKISVRDLRKVSAYYRASSPATPSAKTLKSQITWRLSVNAKGLPTRLVTIVPGSALAASDGAGEKMIVDTRYNGWGGKVSIKAPAADEVTTKLDGGTGDEQESAENLDLFNLLK